MKIKWLVIFFCLCFSDRATIQIDASSYTDWVYFSFSSGEIVQIDNPLNSDEWDLGLMRNHFRTNSGLSGSGLGGAYVDSSLTWTTESWASIIEVPQDAIFEDDGMLDTIYDLQTHEFTESPGSLVLETWGWVDLDNNYEFNCNNHVFFIKTANGQYVKFWPYSYYNSYDSSGHISIVYETDIPISNCSNSGDVNFDFAIDVLDVVIIQNYIVGNNTLLISEQCEANINSDSYLDILDIILIVNLILN